MTSISRKIAQGANSTSKQATTKARKASNQINISHIEDDILRIDIHIVNTINLLTAALAEFKQYKSSCKRNIISETELFIKNAINEATGDIAENVSDMIEKKYNLY